MKPIDYIKMDLDHPGYCRYNRWSGADLVQCNHPDLKVPRFHHGVIEPCTLYEWKRCPLNKEVGDEITNQG